MAKQKALLAAVVATLSVVPQAQALTVNLIDTGGAGAGTQARLGFEIASAYWASVFTDNVTVNLNIGFQSLGTGILGSTSSARSLLSMNQTYSALSADRTSALDFQAVSSLQPLGVSVLGASFGAVSVTANAINATNNGYLDSATRFDNDGGVNNSATAITKASAKALGVTTDANGNAINYASADAAITFSSNFAFDFNPTNGITAGQYDFIGVAIHEIGHALGFVSGVDSYDGRTGPGGPNATLGTLEGFVVASQLDLFRYSAADKMDWSTSADDKFFSIDRGVSQLFGDSRMSLGRFNGDGRQASHFKDGTSCTGQLGVMDPTFCSGTLGEISALDLAAFDAIGWNLNMDVLANRGYRYTTVDAYLAYVPEPSSWTLMFPALAAAFLATRSRRRSLPKTAA